MFYPEDFKSRVKKAYPNWYELHMRLEDGEVFVGGCLKNNYHKTISINAVLTATSLEELQEKVKPEKEKEILFQEWCKLYKQQDPCSKCSGKCNTYRPK